MAKKHDWVKYAGLVQTIAADLADVTEDVAQAARDGVAVGRELAPVLEELERAFMLIARDASQAAVSMRMPLRLVGLRK